MRLGIVSVIVISTLGFAAPSWAQSSDTKPATPQSDTAKPETQTESQSDSQVAADLRADKFDKINDSEVDDFFKKGEEQAKGGKSCSPPPDPIA